jgi:quinol monooxygenase YgiN
MYCYIWEYIVRRDRIAEFQAAYGPEGPWVELFMRDPAYLRTELLRDLDDPLRFVTIDCWVDKSSCDAFRRRVDHEFGAIDARCEALTERETFLGDFLAST